MKSEIEIEKRISDLEKDKDELSHAMDFNADLQKSPYMKSMVDGIDAKIKELKWVMNFC